MQSILQHLFKTDNLENVPVDAIHKLIRDYPFFPAGHYFLAKKLYADNDPAYKNQLRAAGIYFYNPLWLQFQFPARSQELTTPDLSPVPQPRIVEEGSYSADLIESVVLHQESVYNGMEITPETFPVNAPSDALSMAETTLPGVDTEIETAAKDVSLDDKEEVLPLQAFHTIDYFASQGIRVSQELAPDDKLGKQLKSFTEWLKTMRRLPQTPLEEIPEVVIADTEVEKFAAHSLDENEVVTEAMAEVLMKQGKKEKAREVYHKLSLLNPQKSAYFAAKIEVLKQH